MTWKIPTGSSYNPVQRFSCWYGAYAGAQRVLMAFFAPKEILASQGCEDHMLSRNGCMGAVSPCMGIM